MFNSQYSMFIEYCSINDNHLVGETLELHIKIEN